MSSTRMWGVVRRRWWWEDGIMSEWLLGCREDDEREWLVEGGR